MPSVFIFLFTISLILMLWIQCCWMRYLVLLIWTSLHLFWERSVLIVFGFKLCEDLLKDIWCFRQKNNKFGQFRKLSKYLSHKKKKREGSSIFKDMNECITVCYFLIFLEISYCKICFDKKSNNIEWNKHNLWWKIT